MKLEIKYRYTGAVLHSLECASLKICVEDAVATNANLIGANLRGANLRGADLRGADLIDAGQDARGYRFFAWRTKDGIVIYRAGCHEWICIAEALAWYDDSYTSGGDRVSCIARLNLLHAEALRRWPTASAKEG